MHHIFKTLPATIAIVCAPFIAAATTPGHLIKCIFGDCQNGTGEGIISLNDNFVGEIHYKGGFKNGLMDGEGVAAYSDGRIIIGEFTRNEPSGKGSQWQGKTVAGQVVPDSSADVLFGKWDEDDVMKGIMVNKDGSMRVYTRGHKYLSTNKVKDKWINEQAEAFIAARKGQFAAPAKPTQELRELATRNINVARDRWSECIQWDCLTDRQYYIDVQSNEKYHAMPFGGHVTVQIVAPDNTVAFEAEAGTYWTPRTAGQYTFQVKFYQDKIIGDWREHSSYVDGMRLQWWLKSLRKL